MDHFAHHVTLPTAVANTTVKLNFVLLKPTEELSSTELNYTHVKYFHTFSLYENIFTTKKANYGK